MSELEATHLRGSRWAVRPRGQLGTCGWHPRPWTVEYVTARTAEEAVRKAGRGLPLQAEGRRLVGQRQKRRHTMPEQEKSIDRSRVEEHLSRLHEADQRRPSTVQRLDMVRNLDDTEDLHVLKFSLYLHKDGRIQEVALDASSVPGTHTALDDVLNPPSGGPGQELADTVVAFALTVKPEDLSNTDEE